MPGSPGGKPSIGSDWNGSVRVELDEHLHPALLEVGLVERRLAQVALLVLLVELKRVALVRTKGVCCDTGAAAKGSLESGKSDQHFICGSIWCLTLCGTTRLTILQLMLVAPPG